MKDDLKFELYEPEPCPNCKRIRVGKRRNGKRICEKCCWDVDKGDYDQQAERAMKFVAIDGKEYERDVWHPLPFIVDNKEMVPTLDEPVFVKLENGEEYWWTAWARYPARKTHWMVSSKQ